jgi:septal ring factor EnvC (AmiA/AmiB activator)
MFAKIMVIVNFILAVMFLAAAGTLLGAAEDYKGKYKALDEDTKGKMAALEAQVQQADNKAKENQQRFNDADKALKTAEGQLKQLQDSNNQLNQAAAQMRASLDTMAKAQGDLNSRLTDYSKANDTLRNDLATSESGRKESEAKSKAQADEIARLTQDKDTAERALAASETASKALTDSLDAANTQLKRYRDEKGALTGALVMQDVDGFVQAVNNQVDVCIISVGSKDKVEVGYEFFVYRGNQYVSTIVIDKVFPNHASGTTKPGSKKMDIQAGDEVSTRL